MLNFYPEEEKFLNHMRVILDYVMDDKEEDDYQTQCEENNWNYEDFEHNNHVYAHAVLATRQLLKMNIQMLGQ